MIDNIHNHQIGHTIGNSVVPHSDAANKLHRDDSDATLQVNFGDVIRKAKEATEAETDALQKARELLASGRLTSPENIRSAAENIITFGI
jgi:hypothetical protein